MVKEKKFETQKRETIELKNKVLELLKNKSFSNYALMKEIYNDKVFSIKNYNKIRYVLKILREEKKIIFDEIKEGEKSKIILWKAI